MSSIIEGYNYDIFISYRQKDNKGDQWVSEFVEALKTELESTFKEEISVYFDINPHDGLLETHDVDESLKDKLKCLIFIPIISRTYCDPRAFAWEHEFKAFVEQVSKDEFGMKVKLPNGNVASRVLPVRIYDLDSPDIKLCESVMGGAIRGVEFIYKESGINRPLKPPDDDEKTNLNKTKYRNQINKVGNAIKEIISGLRNESIEQAAERKEDILDEGKPPVKEKSIIVLPFENMSSDPEQEYFSDGLTEEIITDLSYIPDLFVISRNTAMTFKDKQKKTSEIAREVNVRYVLEGSVRKAGNKIRIIAQLIDASIDSHIWAKKYDGSLDDIFDIQEKVSLSIADTLKIKFSEDTLQRITKQSFKDPYVYEIYLQARNENWKFNEISLNKAEEMLKKGLKIAGDNELLYAELCLNNVQYVNNLLKDPITYPAFLEKANQYAIKAIETNPSSALAHYARGMALYQSCHPKETIESWRQAIAIEPNHSEPMLFLMLGFMYAMTGFNLNESENLLRKGSIMDPLNPLAKAGQGWLLFFEGKYEECLKEFSEWQHQLEQFNSSFLTWFAWINGLNQNYNEAFRIIDKLVSSNPKHIASYLSQFMKYSWVKDKKNALRMVTESLEKAAWWDDGYSMNMAEGYSVLEEYDKAFMWLNRAIDYGVTNIPFLTEHDHFLENLRKDVRFDECLKKATKIIESLSE